MLKNEIDRAHQRGVARALLKVLGDAGHSDALDIEVVDEELARALVQAALKAVGVDDKGRAELGGSAITSGWTQCAVAYGNFASASASYALAFGKYSCATHDHSVAVGPERCTDRKGRVNVNVAWLRRLCLEGDS